MKTSYRKLLIAGVLAGSFAFFQNCSNVDFASSPALNGEDSVGGLDQPSTPTDGDGSGENQGDNGSGSNGSNGGNGGSGGSGGGSPVLPLPEPIYETIFQMKTKALDIRESSQVDVLFVVDNSGSMSQEQAELANRIAGFMALIQNLDWQIALTTTDPRSSADWGDGKFRTFSTGQPILKAGEQTLEVAEAALAQAINVGTSGSGAERGVHATSRALARTAESEVHNRFFRRNASLAVILISDENECSNGGCLNNEPTSVPENLVAQVRQQFGMEKRFAFHSIIKVPGDPNCRTAATEGTVYQQLSMLTGGVVGSICATSYASLLNIVGQRVIDLVNSTMLTCPPADIDGDGKKDLFLTLQSGEVILQNMLMIQGASVGFAAALPAGNHVLTYHCAEKRLVNQQPATP